ncbi:MAG TPA: hypothetical protein VGK84_06135 [Candidatus Tumulicola sp.]
MDRAVLYSARSVQPVHDRRTPHAVRFARGSRRRVTSGHLSGAIAPVQGPSRGHAGFVAGLAGWG